MEKVFILLACTTMFMLFITVSYDLYIKIKREKELDKAKKSLKENLEKLSNELKESLKEDK